MTGLNADELQFGRARLAQVFGDLRLDECDKLRLHELVVVGNAQANDSLATQVCAEVFGELPLVLLLHDEDDIGPFDQFR